MNRQEFMSIKVIKNDNFNGLKKGDRFLYGESMIDQINNKEDGDIVTFYEVLKTQPDKRIVYVPITDVLNK